MLVKSTNGCGLVVALFAACTSTSKVLVPADDGGAATSGVLDGGGESESGGADAGDSTLATDGPAGDALPDGMPNDAAPDSPSMPWCAGRETAFCADFDTVAAVTDGFTTANVAAGGTLDFDLVAFTSPTRSLHSKVPVGSGAGSSSATATKVIPTSVGRSVLEFDCNVASIGTGSGDWLLQIARLGRNGSEGAVGLFAQGAGVWAIFVSTDQPVFVDQLPAPNYGSFVHVSIDVRWSATAGSVRVAFNGVTVFAREAVTTATPSATTSVELSVGLAEVAGATPPGEISIDNVVLQ